MEIELLICVLIGIVIGFILNDIYKPKHKIFNITIEATTMKKGFDIAEEVSKAIVEKDL